MGENKPNDIATAAVIGLSNVIYSGNHGFEVSGSHIAFKPAMSAQYMKILKKITATLKEQVAGITGVIIEDKNISLCLHYRMVAEKQIPLISHIFHQTVDPYVRDGKIQIQNGKKVLEVRPPLVWHKGKIISWLLKTQLPKSINRTVLPLYLGDDRTDEDAFRQLKFSGLTVAVGKHGNSQAQYYLNDSQEVVQFLTKIPELL